MINKTLNAHKKNYKYKGLRNALIVHGVITATTKDNASELLIDAGVNLIYLRRTIRITKKVNHSKLVNFCDTIIKYTAAGLTITDALIEIHDMEKGYFKNIVFEINQKMQCGQSMSKAIKEYDKIFDNIFVNLLQAGESSGNLQKVFFRLLDYVIKTNATRTKLKSAMRYPLFVFIFFILAMGFLNQFLLVQLVAFLHNSNIVIPIGTRLLLKITANFDILAYAVCTLIALHKTAKTVALYNNKIRICLHRFLLRIPYTGNRWKNADMFYFSYTMSILIEQSIQLTDALEISSQVVSNTAIAHSIQKIITKVLSGASMSEAMSADKIFSTIIIKALKIGEKTASLHSSFLQLSIIQYDELQESENGFIKLIEPTLLALIGVFIIFMIIAVILPLYDSISIDYNL
jgi:type II secretory pathway component PulF